MAYELVELRTGNLIGHYGSRRAALRDVFDSVNRYGADSVKTLALGHDAPGGDGEIVAVGKRLIALAEEEFASAKARSNGATRTRSAITGRFVTKETGTRHPKTTVRETAKKK